MFDSMSLGEAREASLTSTGSPDDLSELIQKQQDLENRMAGEGVDRFRRRILKNLQRHQESENDSGRRLLIESITPVTDGITAFLEAASKARGVKHVSVKVLQEVGPEAAALITAKSIIDHLSTKTKSVKMAIKIANMLLDELRYRKFREQCPQIFEWKLRQFNTTSYIHMKRSLDASMSFAEVDVSNYSYSESHRILIGMRCLDIFVATTEYVSFERAYSPYGEEHSEMNVVATQDTIEWLDQFNSYEEFLSPVFMPTLIPPRPWSNTRNGGYWFAMAGKFPLMRTFDGRNQLADLDNVDMPVVYRAVNALQDTSWRVNERVFNVVEQMKVRGNKNACLPSYTDEPLPLKPQIIQVSKDTEKILLQYAKAKRKEEPTPEVPGWSEEQIALYQTSVKNWRTEAHEVHERNYARKCKALALSKTIAMAKMLMRERYSSDESPIPFYFPHTLDFRGRAYAIPLYLQPQGDDIQKGLLMFGEGRALGTLGAAAWLAIHGANCLADAPNGEKLDKLPLQERVDWIYAHNDDIRAVAQDPFSNDWWTKADSPFCFLAFCFEWDGFLRHGTDHVSYLPIAMDGSCNGLQHYSALLRDEEGGRAVNLIPSDTPQDIYRTVAGRVNEILERDAKRVFDHTKDVDKKNEAVLALDWLTWGKVNRTFVKRQVMTLPYGSKQYGFKDQIKVFIKALKPNEQPVFMLATNSKDRGFAHFNYMAMVIWEALSGTVVAACNGMEFFQKLARLCVKENLPISWTVPSGLPIMQSYPTECSKVVDTVLNKLRYRATYQQADFSTLDHHKQVSGVAPNIIHSLDAAAMMLTVSAALDHDIDHFAMIHDSYGTHAACATQLAQSTRSEFVRMYSAQNVLENLKLDILANVSLEASIPDTPELGTLDLDRVLESQYFFA